MKLSPVLFVLLAGIVGSCQLSRSSSASLSEPEIETGFAEVNGTRLYYEVAGAGDPVVLVHGGFGDRRYFDSQFKVLAQIDFVAHCPGGRIPDGDPGVAGERRQCLTSDAEAPAIVPFRATTERLFIEAPGNPIVEHGLEAALVRKPQDRPSRPRKLDGRAEAREASGGLDRRNL